MNRESLRMLQRVELELLKKTHEVCEELGIKYYIIGGTLLGAVRHGGFIPWDVDIDIAMLRHDYDIFKQYWDKNDNDTFFYQDYETEKNHSSCHAILKLKNTEIEYEWYKDDKYKVQCNGIYMDIFPLDAAPDSTKEQLKQARQIKFWSGLIQAKISRDYGAGKIKYIIKKCLSVVLRPISFTSLQKRVEKVMKKYNGHCKKFLVSMASHYSYKKQLMDAEIYGEPQKITFEGLEVYAPNQTTKYLEQIYGNYMELPPEGGRYCCVDQISFVDYGMYEYCGEGK